MLDKIMRCKETKDQPKALSLETIEKVSNYFKKKFDCDLPNGYKKFINDINGFSYDGRSIFCCYNDDIKDNFPRYASLDLVTFNTNFVENTDITDYIILGKSSISYIGYIKNTEKYVIMTNDTMQHLKEFDTFEELLKSFLNLN